MSTQFDTWNFIKDELIANKLVTKELTKNDVLELHAAQVKLLPVIQEMRKAAIEAIAHAKPSQILQMETKVQCEYTVLFSREPVATDFYKQALIEHGVVMTLEPSLRKLPVSKIFPSVEFGEEDDLLEGILVYPRTLIAIEKFISTREDVLAMVHCKRPEPKQTKPVSPTAQISEMRH